MLQLLSFPHKKYHKILATAQVKYIIVEDLPEA